MEPRFGPKSQLTKSDGTWTIRSEIARGIDLDMSQGPEGHRSGQNDTFDTPTCMEVALTPRGHPGVTLGYPGVPPGSKTFILSVSGPRDLLETIPRATSDRMVRIPFNFMSSRLGLG